MIKRLLTLFLILAFMQLTSYAAPSKRVNGYYKRSSNTYVKPYYRTKSDKTMHNNYSTKGNYNPYTGKKGYKQERNKTFNNRGY